MERVIESLQSFYQGEDMEETGDRNQTNRKKKRWTTERQSDGIRYTAPAGGRETKKCGENVSTAQSETVISSPVHSASLPQHS